MFQPVLPSNIPLFDDPELVGIRPTEGDCMLVEREIAERSESQEDVLSLSRSCRCVVSRPESRDGIRALSAAVIGPVSQRLNRCRDERSTSYRFT